MEECRIKLRESRTPTQQMVGKCKRTDKLAERCKVLAQQMLDEQAVGEAALEKRNSIRRNISNFLNSIQKLKVISRSSTVKRTPLLENVRRGSKTYGGIRN